MATLDNYLTSLFNMVKKPVVKAAQPKTVNVTFKACYLMESTDEIVKHPSGKIYTRTITAYNAAGVVSKLRDMFFTDIQIISIK